MALNENRHWVRKVSWKYLFRSQTFLVDQLVRNQFERGSFVLSNAVVRNGQDKISFEPATNELIAESHTYILRTDQNVGNIHACHRCCFTYQVIFIYHQGKSPCCFFNMLSRIRENKIEETLRLCQRHICDLVFVGIIFHTTLQSFC